MPAKHTQSFLFDSYLSHFACLFGDSRSRRTFQAIVQGILGTGSLVCTRIASQAPLLSGVRHGSQRVVRFATGDSTERSSVKGISTASRLVEKLAERGVASLGETPIGTEVWLILDGSDLRKPHAKEMADLMRVRSLQGGLVNGYRTLNVLGVTPQHRALLYHRPFSSKEQDHLSEPHEVQSALTQVGRALTPIQGEHPVRWIMDSGFDDVAVWRTGWEQGQHVLCRVQHMDRLVQYRTDLKAVQTVQANAPVQHMDRLVQYRTLAGQWQGGHLQDAVVQLQG